jgi:microcystin-dependent protein
MLKNTIRNFGIASSATLLLSMGFAQNVIASEPFIAEIKMFGGNFAPRGYAYCDGQLLPISQNTALFSLIGTTYGGDGRTTMGLPDLRGRVAIHAGTGPGLSTYRLGQRGGAENVTLNTNQIPSHNHTASTDLTIVATLKADAGTGDNDAPEANVLARKNRTKIYSGDAPNVSMHADSIEMTASAATTVDNSGGSQSHENRMPYLTINYIIALVGIFPSRS